MYQPDLFESTQESILKKELQKLKESNEKVRKSLFAKHSELLRNYLELCSRVEYLEKNNHKNRYTLCTFNIH